MSIRLVLADDHPLILEGLKNLFKLEADFQVIATCNDVVSALEAVREHQPDILVLDLNMPAGGGLAVAREIQQGAIPTRIVVFTAALDDDELVEAVCGADHDDVLHEITRIERLDRPREHGSARDERKLAALAPPGLAALRPPPPPPPPGPSQAVSRP